MAIRTLFCERTHPCTTAFGRATEIVYIEEGDSFAILVAYLEHLHVRVIGRNVCTRLKVQAIYSMSCIEYTINQYTVDIEIWFYIIFREIIFLLLHLSRIVESIVRLKLKVGAYRLLSIFFYFCSFSISYRFVRSDKIL